MFCGCLKKCRFCPLCKCMWEREWSCLKRRSWSDSSFSHTHNLTHQRLHGLFCSLLGMPSLPVPPSPRPRWSPTPPAPFCFHPGSHSQIPWSKTQAPPTPSSVARPLVDTWSPGPQLWPERPLPPGPGMLSPSPTALRALRPSCMAVAPLTLTIDDARTECVCMCVCTRRVCKNRESVSQNNTCPG